MDLYKGKRVLFVITEEDVEEALEEGESTKKFNDEDWREITKSVETAVDGRWYDGILNAVGHIPEERLK